MTYLIENKFAQSIVSGIVIFLLASCGGGGGGASNTAQITPPATTYTISGTVTGASSVALNLTGTSNASTTTAANGSYSFTGLANGNYTLTPVLNGFTFTPTSRAVTLSSANATSNNFSASANVVTTYSYSYYKRNGSTTPQTATLSNGTLNIDGLSIAGVYFTTSLGGVTCLAGGTSPAITACASPPDAPHTMLLCGPDPVTAAPDTLRYVLFDTPDTNNVSATSTALLNALQSEVNYLGISVYTDCSGIGHTAWIRNFPNTNYYLWPNVFATYTPVYVSNLLAGSVIASTPTAANNYHQYVVIRMGGVFEVWH